MACSISERRRMTGQRKLGKEGREIGKAEKEEEVRNEKELQE